jgi:DNA-binding transcriptional LysR family regulator
LNIGGGVHKHLTIDALKALDAIDKKGSFAAAAESLYKVPSALTYTIKKLEQEMACDLFDRSKQRAVLTPAGKLVLEQGREILLATNRLFDSVKQLESGWETELRIARDTIVNAQPLYSVINEFVELDTNVDVSLSVEALAGGWDALLSRRADIVIGAAGELPKGTFQTKHIGSVQFVFAVAAEHPLVDVAGSIDNTHLLNYPSVVVADTSQLLPTRNSGLFQSKQVIRVGSMEEKIALQSAGAGIGFLPKHLIAEHLKSGKLIEKNCVIPRPQQELYIAWQKSSDGKALNWFTKNLSNQDWSLD